MITNQNVSFDSAIIDSSLVPIFPSSAVQNPVIPGLANTTLGAGANTLQDSTMGQGTASQAAPMSANTSGTTNASGMTLSGAASEMQTIFGIHPVAFWLLVLGAIAYLILWKVHFHAAISE